MNVLLVCAGGFSTSILVKKIEEESKKRNIDIAVSAKPIEDLEMYIEQYDLVLLGPQVKYKENWVKKIVDKYKKIYDVIPPHIYGRMDAASTLDIILKRLNKS